MSNPEERAAMTRTEHDTLGALEVPATCYWGAQTERSRHNFPIGPCGSMPLAIIRAFAVLKASAALTNAELGVLAQDKAVLITRVCDEILAGDLDDEFPLVIWQTGSGTQTNMNVNEVIANRAQVLCGRRIGDDPPVLHPNDDVNCSQSSNDTFPTAMHIALCQGIVERTLPAVAALEGALSACARRFADVVKIGRTHFMDATPLTLGSEFSAWAAQLVYAERALRRGSEGLMELALGGTAVGTGLNAPVGYAEAVAVCIAQRTGLPFVTAANKFAALAAHDAVVEAHAGLRQLAIALHKLASDIRLLASGPRAGLGELRLPANEPGSSIMPGKVNPTQIEALTMVCAQVIGNDAAIGFAAAQGQLQLNVYKPLLAASSLQSAELLADACNSFRARCIEGVDADADVIAGHLQRSLMLVTALNRHIGYEKAAAIAKAAFAQGTDLRTAAVASGHLTAAQFDAWVRPEDMLGPRPATTGGDSV